MKFNMLWAVQLINRVRPTGFFRSRYFVSVLAFFGIRLESIGVTRIYSGARLNIKKKNKTKQDILVAHVLLLPDLRSASDSFPSPPELWILNSDSDSLSLILIADRCVISDC